MKKITNKRIFLACTIVLSLFVFANYSFAVFNEKINYQGKLTDTNGLALVDGNKCFKFRLMSALTNGTELWSEEWDAVTAYVVTSNGLFSIMLGTNASISSVNFDSASIYLEVQYDPGCDNTYEEIFAPRKQLGSVASAFEAKKLEGGTWAVPGAIGSTTANTGAFTTLTTSSAGTINTVKFGSATGVLATATNGILTLAGLKSAGYNENLTFDFETTEDVVEIGSGTGVTGLNFGSLIPYNTNGNFLNEEPYDTTVYARSGGSWVETNALNWNADFDANSFNLSNVGTANFTTITSGEFQSNYYHNDANDSTFGYSTDHWYIDTTGPSETIAFYKATGDITSAGIGTLGTVNFGSATGVSATATNGVLTLAGLKSTGNNENLTFDFETTSNKVAVASGTGVTILDLGSLNLATTGTAQTGNTTIGSSGAGVDYTLTFDGETSDGVLTWLEDEKTLKIGSTGSGLWLDGTTGDTPTSGAGTRLMYIPGKAGAFRTGLVSGTQWDAANIGSYSFAAGYNNTASGNGAIALGSTNAATGSYSLAAGQFSSTAGGDSQISLGYGASTTCDKCLALGNVANTSSSSLAVGFGQTDFTVSSGQVTAVSPLVFSSTLSGTGSTVVADPTNASLSFDYGGGYYYTANYYNSGVRVYAYKVVDGITYYSASYSESSGQDDASGNYELYYIWDTVAGADGYRLLKYSDEYSMNYDYYVDTAGPDYYDNDSGNWTAGNTVTPTSVSAFSVDSSGNLTDTATTTLATLKIGSTVGVSATAANGVLTLAGLKLAGNNENLTLDFETTSNKVAIASGTGVTTIDFGSLNLTTSGALGAGVGTLSGGNGNAAFTLLNLNNTANPATGNTAQTSDLVFNLMGTINSGSTFVSHEAARISVYKTSDWWHASTEADYNSGLKFYTVVQGTENLALTINNFGNITLNSGLSFTADAIISNDTADVANKLTVNHIGEHTGSHGIVFDNAVNLGANTLTTTGTITAPNINHATQLNLQIGTTSQINLVDGKLAPTTNNDIDLGDDTHRFKDLYLVGSTIHMGTSGDEGTLTYTTATNTWDFTNNITTTGTVSFGSVTTNTINSPTTSDYWLQFQPGVYGANGGIAIGTGTVLAGQFAVGIGRSVWATGANSTAIGYGAYAANTSSLAIGYGAYASANNAVTIGDNIDNTTANSVLFGANSTKYLWLTSTLADFQGLNVTSTGTGTFGAGGILGVDAATNTAGTLKFFSVGTNDFYSTFTAGTQTANATYTLPTAMPSSTAKFLQSTTGGVLSWVTALTSFTESDPVWVAWKAGTSLTAGLNASNNVAHAVCIGDTATCYFDGSSSPNPIGAVLIGAHATAYGNYNGVIIGYGAHDGANTGANGYNVVIGGGATSGSDNNVVVGNSAIGTGDNNVVIGMGATSGGYSNCIAIGYGAACTGSNQTVIAGAGGPAGSSGDIQYNDSSSFGGFGDWDGTNLSLSDGNFRDGSAFASPATDESMIEFLDVNDLHVYGTIDYRGAGTAGNISIFNNDATYITQGSWDSMGGTQSNVNVSGFNNDSGYLTWSSGWLNETQGNINVGGFNNDAGYLTSATESGGTSDTYDDGTDTVISFTNGHATGISTAFDETLMKNIVAIDSVLPYISEIRPSIFEWNEEGLKQFVNPDENKSPRIGFVAQDFQEHFSQLLVEEKNGKITYNRNDLQVFLLKAIQELNSEAKELKIELGLATGDVGEGKVTGVTVGESFVQSIKVSLANLGMAIEDGVVTLKEVVADKFTAKTVRMDKMEMVDAETGDIYCTWIAQGEWQKEKGDCSSIGSVEVVPPVGGVTPPVEEVIPPAEVTPPAEEVIPPEEVIAPPVEEPVIPEAPKGNDKKEPKETGKPVEEVIPEEPIITPEEPVITPEEPVITPEEPVIEQPGSILGALKRFLSKIDPRKAVVSLWDKIISTADSIKEALPFLNPIEPLKKLANFIKNFIKIY